MFKGIVRFRLLPNIGLLNLPNRMVDVNRLKGLHFIDEYPVAKLTVAPACIALNSSLDSHPLVAV